MAIYEFAAIQPVVEPGAYVHPEATLIGDVWIAAGAYIAPQAVLRGDYGRLIVESEANVQDGCVLHGYAQVDTVVGAGSSIGHGAVLHGCRIGRNCLVGINAVALDGAYLGDDSILAAMSLLPSGYRAASQQLFKGIPARPTRAVTQREMLWQRSNAREYAELARRAPAQLRVCQALSVWPENRPYLSATTDARPIHDPDDAFLKGQGEG